MSRPRLGVLVDVETETEEKMSRPRLFRESRYSLLHILISKAPRVLKFVMYAN